ncbi:hypothetical protein ASU33_11260 [Solirubrum puertoriconensis]|uniref:histidine kinase n=1 Tax=Solirubrum puertoriconensis TaxID=1751427 RepID=A0A9X0HMK0_SOLP1|nr:hypothetical protein ASU33_11260 [Solirubrum puertoriconensis]
MLAADAPHYTILAVSDELLRITGRTRVEVVNRSLFDFYPETIWAAAHGAVALRASLDEGLRSKQSNRMPVVRYEVQNAAGELEPRCWAACTKPLLNAAGQVQYLLHTGEDITAQVLAEEQQKRVAAEPHYRTLLEESPVATALYLGPELRIQYANALMLSYWGKDAAIIGLPFRQALPELQHLPLPILLEQVYASGEAHAGVRERVIRNVDGQPRASYFSYTYKPLRDAAGRVYGVHHTAVDVSAEAQALLQIEESEQRFRTMVEQAPVAITLTEGPDLVIQSVNGPMLRMMNKTAEAEVLGLPIAEVLPRVAAHGILQVARQVLETGQPFRGDAVPAQTIGSSGALEWRYYNVSYTPLRQGGRVTGLIHVAIDVTEQVLARQKVEAERERARLAIEVGGLGVFETNLLSGAMLTDARCNEIFGFATPQTWACYVEAILPDDRPIRDKALQQGLASGSFAYEVRICRPDGQVRWVRARGRVYHDAQERPASVLGVIQDNTEQRTITEALREGEQRFRIMADAAPNMVWAVYPDSTIRYLNQAFLEFVGVNFDEYLRTGWGPYMHPDELTGAQLTLEQAIAERRMYVLEHRMRRRDGQYRWLLAQGAPSYYPNGELYGYVGSAIDITELKHTNEQLRRTNQDLDNFVYAASHDLKQPVSNLTRLLEELRFAVRFDDPAEEKLLLPLIQNTLHHLTVTIDDLAALGQAQRPLAVEAEEVRLADLASEVLSTLSPQVQAAQALVYLDFSSCPTISFARANLRTVLLNLVGNALKYADPQRPARVHLTAWAERGQVVLEVQDNGLGFDADKYGPTLFRLFQRFHQHIPGTGVGLYLVNRIVQANGGRIEVSSRVGEGATFRIWLGAAQPSGLG